MKEHETLFQRIRSGWDRFKASVRFHTHDVWGKVKMALKDYFQWPNRNRK